MALEKEMLGPEIIERDIKKAHVSFTKYRNTFLAAASAFSYALLIGMVSSYPAPATADMKKPGSRFRGITPNEITWIASLPMISGVLGNTLSGYATQKFGRKTVLIWLSFPYLLSWLIVAYSPTIGTIFVGRLVSGLTAGMTAVTVPPYIVEIAPTEIRGLLTSSFSFFCCAGTLIVMCLGSVMRWSWLAISGAVVLLLGTCMMALMPESPPWLVSENRTVEAARALKFLRGKDFDVVKEIEDLKENSTKNPQQQGESFRLRDIKDSNFYKPLAIGMAVMFFHISSGNPTIMVYTVNIFEQVGSSVQANVASIIVATVQVISTVLSSLLMDRVGRRPLFIASSIFSALSQFTCGTYLYLASKNNVDQHSYGWIPLASVMVFMFSFVIGIGAMPFVIIPEICPLKNRSIIGSITAVFFSLCGFFMIKMFDILLSSLGMHGLFWMFSFFLTLSVAFGYFFLPETKGMDLKEVQSKYIN